MALELNGTTDRITYTSPGDFNSGARTILLDYWPDVDTQNNDYFFGANISGSTGNVEFLFQLGPASQSAGRLRIGAFGPVGASAYTAPDILTVGQWNTCGFTWDGSGDLSTGAVAYANGASIPWETAGTGGSFGATAGDWAIGNRGAGDRGIDGRIGRYVILNKVATAQEIADFEAGIPVRTIWSDGDILLAPDTSFGGNWDSTVSSVTQTATITGTTQVADRVFSEVLDAESASFVLSFPDVTLTPPNPPSGGTLDAEPATFGLAFQDLIINSMSIKTDFLMGNLNLGTSFIADQGTVTPTATIFVHPGVNTGGASPTDIYNGFYGQITGASGKQVTFRLSVTTPLRVGGTPPANWRPWFSYDGITWTRFDNASTTTGVVTFSHNTAFTGSSVFIAHRPRQSSSHVRAFLDSIVASHPTLVSMPPSSAGSDFGYFTTTATTKVDGTPLAATPLVSYRVSDDSLQPLDGSPKRTAVLISGLHAGEDQGEWALQNFVEFLLGGSAKALNLRRNFEFFSYPLINTTGRDGGEYRGTRQSGKVGIDPNRIWATGPIDSEEVQAAIAAITQDTQNGMQVFIDFHGRGLDNPPAIFAHPGGDDDNFVANVQTYMPAITKVTSGEASGISTVFMRAQYTPKVATTAEGDGTISDVVEFENFGEALAQGLSDSFDDGDFDVVGPIAFNVTFPDVSLSGGGGAPVSGGTLIAEHAPFSLSFPNALLSGGLLQGSRQTFIEATYRTLVELNSLSYEQAALATGLPAPAQIDWDDVTYAGHTFIGISKPSWATFKPVFDKQYVKAQALAEYATRATLGFRVDAEGLHLNALYEVVNAIQSAGLPGLADALLFVTEQKKLIDADDNLEALISAADASGNPRADVNPTTGWPT